MLVIHCPTKDEGELSPYVDGGPTLTLIPSRCFDPWSVLSVLDFLVVPPLTCPSSRIKSPLSPLLTGLCPITQMFAGTYSRSCSKSFVFRHGGGGTPGLSRSRPFPCKVHVNRNSRQDQHATPHRKPQVLLERVI